MKNLVTYLFLCLVLLSWSAAAAQGIDCVPVEIREATTVKLPDKFKEAQKLRVVRFTPQGALELVDNLEFAITGGNWSIDQSTLNKLKELRGRPDRRITELVGFKDSQLVDRTRFVLDGESKAEICANGGADDGGITTNASEALRRWQRCQEEFKKLDQDIRQNRLKNGKYTVIVFMPSGKVCGQSRPFGVSGDLIYTAVFDDGTITSAGTKVEFTKCEVLSPTPKNPELETLVPKLDLQARVVRPLLFEFPARQCFGSSAEMKLRNKVKEGNEPEKDVDVNYSLPLYERYRYTLQVGVVETAQRNKSFGLRDMKIFSKGPEGRGPEYLATVVLYGLPRYFGVLTQRAGSENAEQDVTRAYYGRDPIHEQGLADRIGFVIGAGLKNPSDRFGVGLSFEIGYGVNLIGMYERAKLKKLAVVKEGDVFTGTVEQIPTREVWEEDWVFGLSLDLRYITGLFKRAS